MLKANLVRVSKADALPIKRSTLYKWNHLRKFPQLFLKVGGMLFVDLDVLDGVIEAGRLG
ncbi:MAG: hypothetical protein WB948_10830 [Desulfobaccales bacterium]